MVTGSEEDLAGAGAQVVDAAVADVGHEASALVQAEEGHGGAHAPQVVYVGSVEGVVGLRQCILELLVGEGLVGGEHVLGGAAETEDDGGAGHLALFVTAHAVAHQEQAAAGGGCSQGGIDGVLLIAALTQFMDGLRLVYLYFHELKTVCSLV